MVLPECFICIVVVGFIVLCALFFNTLLCCFCVEVLFGNINVSSLLSLRSMLLVSVFKFTVLRFLLLSDSYFFIVL